MICEALYPSDDLQELTVCSCCEMSYTGREYKILKAADKLGFFYSKEYGVFCNFCFVEFIKNLKTSDEKEKIIINVKNKKIIIDENEY